MDCTSWPYICILALDQYTHRKFDVFSFSANFGNNRATLLKHVARCNMYMLHGHGHTLKSATSDYNQRHVIAFRPISVALAARSWSYDNSMIDCCRNLKVWLPHHFYAKCLVCC